MPIMGSKIDRTTNSENMEKNIFYENWWTNDSVEEKMYMLQNESIKGFELHKGGDAKPFK